MTTPITKIKAEHDSAWKDIIDCYLKEILQLCFPEFYAEIDWSKEWTSLDKELQAITKGGLTGKLYVDKLIRVHLKNGMKPRILIHFEIDPNPTEKFPERMLIYNTRSYDKHREPVFSCAILADLNPAIRPNHFEIKVGESKLRLDFALCKLLDFEQRREELEKSSSPFATVILCHLDAMQTKKQNYNQRLHTKITLAKKLYKKGFAKIDIVNLCRFLEFSIALPKELEIEYQEELYKIEEESHMPFLTNIERRALAIEEKALSDIRLSKKKIHLAEKKIHMADEKIHMADEKIHMADEKIHLGEEKIQRAEEIEQRAHQMQIHLNALVASLLKKGLLDPAMLNEIGLRNDEINNINEKIETSLPA